LINPTIKKEIFKQIKPFKGIPTVLDYILYNQLYYSSVREHCKSNFEDATILDVVKTMNSFGNLLYFNWFPDLYNTSREKLGQFFNPVFRPVNGNEYADFLHGLTHIRSMSSHTNLGEAMVIPDNFINIGVPYRTFLNLYKDNPLQECTKPTNAFFPQAEKAKSSQFQLFSVCAESKRFLRKGMVFYKDIYKEGFFKADIGNDGSPGINFLFAPQTSTEQRMSNNFIRAIFLNEKFRLQSGLNKSYKETPVSELYDLPADLLFTSDLEDRELAELNALITKELSAKEILSKSLHLSEVAIRTTKELVKFK
jgi:hypothetical protein